MLASSMARKGAASTAFEFGYNAGWDAVSAAEVNAPAPPVFNSDLRKNANAQADWLSGYRRGAREHVVAISGPGSSCRGSEAGCYG